jgi:hypothetical protein
VENLCAPSRHRFDPGHGLIPSEPARIPTPLKRTGANTPNRARNAQEDPGRTRMPATGMSRSMTNRGDVFDPVLEDGERPHRPPANHAHRTNGRMTK